MMGDIPFCRYDHQISVFGKRELPVILCTKMMTALFYARPCNANFPPVFSKESGIWKHRRRSPAVSMVAVPEDDLITAKALSID